MSLTSTVSRPTQSFDWKNAAFWVGIAAAWLVWLPNLLHLQTTGGEWPLLFILSPLFGAVALGVAIWMRSWWRVPVALVLGVGASWVLISVGYVIESMST